MLGILAMLCGLVSLGCFIYVVVQMFSHGETTMGIITVVTLFCAIGGLICFVYGWMKSAQWNLLPVMAVWSGAIVLGIVLNVMQMAAAQ